MSIELKEVLEAQAKAFEELKAEVNRGDAKNQTVVDNVNKHLDELAERQKSIEAKLARAGEGEAKATEAREVRAAFVSFMRKGGNPDALKAMRVGDDANGGYAVPQAVEGPIVERIFDGSPIRQIANVVTITGAALEGVVDYGQLEVEWLDEVTDSVDPDTPTMKKYRISVDAQRSSPKIGPFLLEDAMFDVEGWLGQKIARDFALSEQTAFVAGSGAGKPRGFATYTTAATADSSRTWGQLEHVVTGTSGGFGTNANGVDKLTDLTYKLKAGYRTNGRWVMSKATLGTLRQLKTSGGDYVWAPSVMGGAQGPTPATLLGYPVVEAEDMPAIGASSLSIAFGDFRAGYTIVDRSGITILRDPFSNAPYVTFRCVRRVGGGVVDFDAIKFLKFST